MPKTVDEVRVETQPDIWEMGPDGKARRIIHKGLMPRGMANRTVGTVDDIRQRDIPFFGKNRRSWFFK